MTLSLIIPNVKSGFHDFKSMLKAKHIFFSYVNIFLSFSQTNVINNLPLFFLSDNPILSVPAKSLNSQ